MATTKERKVYGINNFRGLDTENKPLKVESYRAVDGHNFELDSDILKTRSGFKYTESPLINSVLEEGEHIIDFYKFRGIDVFVTNYKMFFRYEGEILDDIKIKTTIKKDYDFEGKQPLFVEEKDCLFVFCLGNIFVVSSIYDNENIFRFVVWYPLNKKPNNPFDVGSHYYKAFEELPTPYEPTIFIGEERFEDVNLLSNVTKYQLFSKINDKNNDNIYNLPTTFEYEKNGNYSAEISFYKNRYPNLKVLPVYLGKLGEDFSNINYTILNDTNPIEITTIFYPLQNFEYSSLPNNPTPIREILGFTKKDFYESRIRTASGDTTSVFEYVMTYINNTFPDGIYDENKILKFKLKYKATCDYRDASNNIIEDTLIEEKEEFIYLKLEKYKSLEIKFEEQKSKFTGSSFVVNLELPYPNYSTFSNSTQTYEIFNSPVKVYKNTEEYFRGACQNWLNDNKNNPSFANDTYITLEGRTYESVNVPNTSVVELEDEREWLISDALKSDEIDIWNKSIYPPFPTFDNEGQAIIDVGILSLGNKRFYEMETEIEDIIFDRISELPNEKEAYCKVRFFREIEDNYGNISSNLYSLVIYFNYEKHEAYTYENRVSYAIQYYLVQTETINRDNLYILTYDYSINSFVFKCEDFLYDFNNEPSIDIKITFANNPDYKKVINNKFGILFGTENRLFLAGDEDYPNIDRYNISNDLLGNNEKNQSYELSFFPSKNYRVVGDKNAINGYVIATDNELYVTKDRSINAPNLYIRTRNLDNNGLVQYSEFKTSINKTPINFKCLARFYNDVIILDESGLYAIEISSNIQTNERLTKLRSGFINKDLVASIKAYGTKDIFFYEDNFHMYIFIGKEVYVLDSRYTDKNRNSEIGNISYEIVKWDIPIEVRKARAVDNELLMLAQEGEHFYKFEDNGYDNNVITEKNYMSLDLLTGISYSSTTFTGSEIDKYLDIKNVAFRFYDKELYKILATLDDYTATDMGDYVLYNIINDYAFRNITNGSKVCYRSLNRMGFTQLEVYDMNEDRTEFKTNKPGVAYGIGGLLLTYVKNEFLYPKIIFDDEGIKKTILSPNKPDEIIYLEQEVGEDLQDYYIRVQAKDDDYSQYLSFNVANIYDSLLNVLVMQNNLIDVKWISPILDFGNNFSEKTMFRANLYATRKNTNTTIKIGYRTMRKFIQAEQKLKVLVSSSIEDLDEFSFNFFAMNDFASIGSSIPMKANNFLYIQYVVVVEGNIEFNGIEILYKNNRSLKTLS